VCVWFCLSTICVCFYCVVGFLCLYMHVCCIFRFLLCEVCVCVCCVFLCLCVVCVLCRFVIFFVWVCVFCVHILCTFFMLVVCVCACVCVVFFYAMFVWNLFVCVLRGEYCVNFSSLIGVFVWRNCLCGVC